jgi:hypothetical protein
VRARPLRHAAPGGLLRAICSALRSTRCHPDARPPLQPPLAFVEDALPIDEPHESLAGWRVRIFAVAVLCEALPSKRARHGHVAGVVIAAVVALGPAALWFRASARPRGRGRGFAGSRRT